MNDRQQKHATEKQRKEKELSKVKITKEDVDLIVSLAAILDNPNILNIMRNNMGANLSKGYDKSLIIFMVYVTFDFYLTYFLINLTMP